MKSIATFNLNQKLIAVMAFDSELKTLAFGNVEGKIILSNLESKSQVVSGHKREITSISLSPDGQILAAGNANGIIKLWAIDGTPLLTLKGDGTQVTSLSFSSDSRSLLAGSTNGNVMLWRLNIDDLLNQGCRWIQDYWDIHPRIQEDLPGCR